MTDDLSVLSAAWIKAKEDEREAMEHRRHIEDVMKSLIGITETMEGVETASPAGYVVKITGRLDRKVDADLLQDLATEAGLTASLTTLFRWRPEINLTAWRNADPSITNSLAGAITTKPGRPSFSIIQEK
jgi:hypothetical protein